MAAIVCVGSLAFDSLETPFGKVSKILGGSANYFSLAASYFAPVRCVSVVGEDFPEDQFQELKRRHVDIEGIQRAKGQTFHWSGKYGFDLNQAHTLDTRLNVFEHFDPIVPASYRNSEIVFLGNVSPRLQMKVLAQMTAPKFIALDTMNFWIEGQREDLVEAIRKCHALIINESELRQLTKQYNIVQAAKMVRDWGPEIVLIKRGEYGAVLFHRHDVFGVPALPLAEVKDPTGAGDTFAGGFLGYLASLPSLSLSDASLRQAVVFGSILASFTVQDFGFQELLRCTRADIDNRYKHFVELTTFHGKTSL